MFASEVWSLNEIRQPPITVRSKNEGFEMQRLMMSKERFARGENREVQLRAIHEISRA